MAHTRVPQRHVVAQICPGTNRLLPAPATRGARLIRSALPPATSISTKGILDLGHSAQREAKHPSAGAQHAGQIHPPAWRSRQPADTLALLQMVEARMRKALLALIFAGVAPVAMAAASGPAIAGAARAAPKAVDAPSAVIRVDYNRRYYNGRYHHRGHRHYYRRHVDYGYAPRKYYRAPAYYAPPVVYYPPPVVVYYPPPVVYSAYPPPVAHYRYGAPAAAYYDAYSEW